eukprot:Cvel_32007.t1-p1 / transcript=Cvel_32007.t1 / gene=Cvel_32007 / organism=Chromera_velia_CCMP2878 / gene_product=hypothetical protein / transcript_product=hypothetical protein / location=Cvel_scaffold4877:1313-7031(+) / protein_length=683 / sequence_SO=supercontig / SO=protein_coding / is_pseudo=false
MSGSLSDIRRLSQQRSGHSSEGSDDCQSLLLCGKQYTFFPSETFFDPFRSVRRLDISGNFIREILSKPLVLHLPGQELDLTGNPLPQKNNRGLLLLHLFFPQTCKSLKQAAQVRYDHQIPRDMTMPPYPADPSLAIGASMEASAPDQTSRIFPRAYKGFCRLRVVNRAAITVYQMQECILSAESDTSVLPSKRRGMGLLPPQENAWKVKEFRRRPRPATASLAAMMERRRQQQQQQQNETGDESPQATTPARPACEGSDTDRERDTGALLRDALKESLVEEEKEKGSQEESGVIADTEESKQSKGSPQEDGKKKVETMHEDRKENEVREDKRNDVNHQGSEKEKAPDVISRQKRNSIANTNALKESLAAFDAPVLPSTVVSSQPKAQMRPPPIQDLPSFAKSTKSKKNLMSSFCPSMEGVRKRPFGGRFGQSAQDTGSVSESSASSSEERKQRGGGGNEEEGEGGEPPRTPTDSDDSTWNDTKAQLRQLVGKKKDWRVVKQTELKRQSDEHRPRDVSEDFVGFVKRQRKDLRQRDVAAVGAVADHSSHDEDNLANLSEDGPRANRRAHLKLMKRKKRAAALQNRAAGILEHFLVQLNVDNSPAAKKAAARLVDGNTEKKCKAHLTELGANLPDVALSFPLGPRQREDPGRPSSSPPAPKGTEECRTGIGSRGGRAALWLLLFC